MEEINDDFDNTDVVLVIGGEYSPAFDIVVPSYSRRSILNPFSL
jgi:NAD/NADP transhydrogenase beta subunit